MTERTRNNPAGRTMATTHDQDDRFPTSSSSSSSPGPTPVNAHYYLHKAVAFASTGQVTLLLPSLSPVHTYTVYAGPFLAASPVLAAAAAKDSDIFLPRALGPMLVPYHKAAVEAFIDFVHTGTLSPSIASVTFLAAIYSLGVDLRAKALRDAAVARLGEIPGPVLFPGRCWAEDHCAIWVALHKKHAEGPWGDMLAARLVETQEGWTDLCRMFLKRSPGEEGDGMSAVDRLGGFVLVLSKKAREMRMRPSRAWRKMLFGDAHIATDTAEIDGVGRMAFTETRQPEEQENANQLRAMQARHDEMAREMYEYM
ncbi:hypothetical protein EDC01DRAFT_446239 [Geopyxis carbonaria]|nr:hypothetical protein EDC01DRAFT_446239 [Geopyxis carbonaria]